jgi:ribosomal protein S18 acetylase RimI-like enzyme
MHLEFVNNEEKYYEFIRLLRMNRLVSYGFVQQTYITPEQHKIYMDRYGSCYYICLADGVPAGYVGAVNDDIRVATLPEYQRVGLGSFMVRELLKRHPSVYARIKVDNSISSNFFKKLGFNLAFYIMTPPNEET